MQHSVRRLFEISGKPTSTSMEGIPVATAAGCLDALGCVASQWQGSIRATRRILLAGAAVLGPNTPEIAWRLS